MWKWFKRILQKPGHETQSVTERPSEFYQLKLPDFRIPTVTNSADSVMTGLANRKWRDTWEHKGRASGINNTDGFLQQEHPSLFLLPFAPEVMGSGLGLGVLKTLGGYAGSYAGSKIGNEIGYALDNTFNKQLFEPLGEVVGSFAGFGKGYNLFGKAGMQGALKYLSKTGKDVPRWFMRPELRTNVGRVNQRTFFAEDQTPKYNSNQLPGSNIYSYQSPSSSKFTLFPQMAFASSAQKQAYQRPQTSLTPLKGVFGDSLNIPDMVDFYKGSKPMLFADMREVMSDPNFTYFQGRPFIDYARPEGGIGRFYINQDKLKQTIGAYKDLYTSRLNLPNTATVDDVYNHILSNPAKIDPGLNKEGDIQDILGLSLGYGIKDAMLFKDPYLLDLDGTYKETVPGVFDMLNKRLASKQLSKTYGETNGNHMTWQFRESPLDRWSKKKTFMPLPDFTTPTGNSTQSFGETAIPNNIESLSTNFSNYFGKPVENLTVDDWDAFINGNPEETYGLNIKNIRPVFNTHKDEFRTGDTYHGKITGSDLFREILQMSRDKAPYDMSKHQDVLDYMREYAGRQYLSNFLQAISQSRDIAANVDIQHIKDVFANPAKYISITHGYTRPGTGGHASGSTITVPFDYDFTDTAFAHELHHAIRNHLFDYLSPNYNVFGTTSPLQNTTLMSGQVTRTGKQPYFDFELSSMRDLAFNKAQSSDKTPSSEIGAVITSEYTFPQFIKMKESLGRFPTPEELWTSMNDLPVDKIRAPRAYRDAIGSMHKDNRSRDWQYLRDTYPAARFNRLMTLWNNQPWWYRLFHRNQKPTFRYTTDRLRDVHVKASVNAFQNALKRVMTTVPAVAAPIVAQESNNTEEPQNNE